MSKSWVAVTVALVGALSAIKYLYTAQCVRRVYASVD